MKTEVEKEKSLKEIVNLAAFPLLSAFLAFGLKTHIETMIINDATKEEYVLTFETASRFRERFKQSPAEPLTELRKELIGYKNIQAVVKNFLSVYETKNWERIEKKVYDLQQAINYIETGNLDGVKRK